MRANRQITISVILAIFLSFFSPLDNLGLNMFPDNMYPESFERESFIDFQQVLILKTEKETPDDDLSPCLYLTIDHLPNSVAFVICRNCISEKKIFYK
jgi:hypothetical protein